MPRSIGCASISLRCADTSLTRYEHVKPHPPAATRPGRGHPPDDRRISSRRTAYGAVVAERLGLAPADVEVLTALGVEGAMTVGRIGELTGLTTGATTRMVDRLEQGGFVRRVADPADRRRVIVEPAGDRARGHRAGVRPDRAGRRARRSRTSTSRCSRASTRTSRGLRALRSRSAAAPPDAGATGGHRERRRADRLRDQRPAGVRHGGAGGADQARARTSAASSTGPGSRARSRRRACATAWSRSATRGWPGSTGGRGSRTSGSTPRATGGGTRRSCS